MQQLCHQEAVKRNIIFFNTKMFCLFILPWQGRDDNVDMDKSVLYSKLKSVNLEQRRQGELIWRLKSWKKSSWRKTAGVISSFHSNTLHFIWISLLDHSITSQTASRISLGIQFLFVQMLLGKIIKNCGTGFHTLLSLVQLRNRPSGSLFPC